MQIFLVAAFFIFMQKGVMLSPDSASYINHYMVRMGLYPLTISMFQYLFKEHALQFLVMLQLIFTIFASYKLSSFLRLAFKLPSFLHWGLICVLLSPIVMFNCSNEIMSEGLAYPLFLLTSHYFFKYIALKQIKHLYIFSLCLCLLTFTRQQYLFFYVVSVFAFIYLVFSKGISKKGTHFVFSIALSLFSFFLMERAYHSVYHKAFSGTPFTGIQLLIRPLFLSTSDILKHFNDPKEKQFVQEVTNEMLVQDIIDIDINKRRNLQFELYYNTIYYKIASPTLNKIWPKAAIEAELGKSISDFEYLQAVDSKAIFISTMLIKSNFINYAKSYIKDVQRGFGSYILFGFVLFMVLISLFNITYMRDFNIFYPIFISAGLIHLGNISFVCLVEPPLLRYSYSTGTLLLCMLLIMSYLFANNLPHTKAE